MPRRDDSVSMRHMLDFAREAQQLGREHERAELDSNRLLGLALLQLLLMLGEAAARVSPDRQQHFPVIPWSQIIAMRNRLIHGYDTIDFDIVWQVVTVDLPPLVAAPENAIATWEE